MSHVVQGEGVPGPPAAGPGGPAASAPGGEAGGEEALLARRFRASPRYELVLFDRLSPAERRALARLREQPGFYGVLRAAEGGAGGTALSVKSVDRDTALLLLTLREPGPLPSYLAEVLGAARQRTVARLVADGVLEVESGGDFLSGPAALALLAGGPGEQAGEGAAGEADRPGSGSQPGRQRAGPLAELSLAALRWAARLPVADPALLAARLYAYNRRPLTPAWARRLADPEAVRGYLGLAPGGPAAAALGPWFPVPARGTWLLWGARDAPPRADAGPTFKLYLSPQPEALPAVLAVALALLPGAGAGRLKVGGDAAGLLRPDKLVAYFGDLDRLAAAAGVLAERLAGAPAQGVPFTAEIAGGGLLSWGAEPPRSRLLPGGRESWRLYLANRLGAALAEARAAGENEPWHFALERLRLDGVDTETWAPRALFWADGPG